MELIWRESSFGKAAIYTLHAGALKIILKRADGTFSVTCDMVGIKNQLCGTQGMGATPAETLEMAKHNAIRNILERQRTVQESLHYVTLFAMFPGKKLPPLPGGTTDAPH